ncbi:MAG: mechanosensitive ion channel family protein [Bacteroidota bacterium]
MEQFSEAWSKMWNKLDGWVEKIVMMLPNLLIAAFVMGVSIFIARFVSKYTQKLAFKFTHNKTVSSVISSVITAVFVLISLFLVLSILNLDKALTSLLAGAGVIGLAVGLALQEPLVNLFSGVMMSVRSLFNIDDLVETNGYFGKIKKIDLRSTLLELPTGELVTIPNKEVLQDPLKNFTASGKRRVVLECGVSYGDDLEKVKALTINTVSELLNEEPENIDFYYTAFGDSSINFMLRYWRRDVSQPSVLGTKSDVIMAIKKAYDANDISIPFPIRTLDFGIKGGESLEEMKIFQTEQKNNGYAHSSVEN